MTTGNLTTGAVTTDGMTTDGGAASHPGLGISDGGSSRDVPVLLRDGLLYCAAQGVSGLLRVTGEPGGTIYLSSGNVTAIDTPGAPGPEVILLRSGRIAEPAWTAAFAAGAAAGRMNAELVRRGLVGTGELEALLRVALADAMFALAAGRVNGCDIAERAPGPEYLLPLIPAASAGWLISEAARRVQVLTTLPTAISHDRDRLTLARGVRRPAVPSGTGYDAIIDLANGRRTARDMAFVLGRGVYAVTLQLAQMHAAGLLVVASRRALGSAGPGAAGAPAATGAPAAADAGGADAGQASPLPRRRRAARCCRTVASHPARSQLRPSRTGAPCSACSAPGPRLVRPTITRIEEQALTRPDDLSRGVDGATWPLPGHEVGARAPGSRWRGEHQ